MASESLARWVNHRYAVHLILVGALPLFGASDGSLRVEPISLPEHSTQLISAAARSTWRLRIPERVLADPAVILIDHAGAPVEWSRLPEGGLASIYALGTGPQAEARIGFQVSLEPAPTGLAMTFSVENKMDTTLGNVAGHVCLSHDHGRDSPERFADPNYDHTFIVTADGLVSLSEVDRGGPVDRIRSHYLIEGAKPISFFLTQPFWGLLSKVKAREPWIAGTSASGNWTVAVWWEKAVELFQNSDKPNRCILDYARRLKPSGRVEA